MNVVRVGTELLLIAANTHFDDLKCVTQNDDIEITCSIPLDTSANINYTFLEHEGGITSLHNQYVIQGSDLQPTVARRMQFFPNSRVVSCANTQYPQYSEWKFNESNVPLDSNTLLIILSNDVEYHKPLMIGGSKFLRVNGLNVPPHELHNIMKIDLAYVSTTQGIQCRMSGNVYCPSAILVHGLYNHIVENGVEYREGKLDDGVLYPEDVVFIRYMECKYHELHVFRLIVTQAGKIVLLSRISKDDDSDWCNINKDTVTYTCELDITGRVIELDVTYDGRLIVIIAEDEYGRYMTTGSLGEDGLNIILPVYGVLSHSETTRIRYPECSSNIKSAASDQ